MNITKFEKFISFLDYKIHSPGIQTPKECYQDCKIKFLELFNPPVGKGKNFQRKQIKMEFCKKHRFVIEFALEHDKNHKSKVGQLLVRRLRKAIDYSDTTYDGDLYRTLLWFYKSNKDKI